MIYVNQKTCKNFENVGVVSLIRIYGTQFDERSRPQTLYPEVFFLNSKYFRICLSSFQYLLNMHLIKSPYDACLLFWLSLSLQADKHKAPLSSPPLYMEDHHSTRRLL